MSNRPKGFKRMSKFYITGFNHRTGKVIIKSFDERLPADERYYKQVHQIKTSSRYGRLKLEKLFMHLAMVCTNKHIAHW